MQYSKQKDAQPTETLEKIKKILSDLNITVSETDWVYYAEEESTQIVHTKRIFIEDYKIGANGKGTTPEYGLASAYAELIERLQNLTLGFHLNVNIPDAKKVSQEYFLKKHSQLVDEKFFRYLFQKDAKTPIDTQTPLEEIIQRLQAFVDINPKSALECVPFYNLRKQTTNYLPIKILTSINTSNGMSAGNTPEEALLQGLSEIIERYVQKTVYIEKLNPPLIPEAEYAQYDTIKNLIKAFNELGIHIQIRDASLGKGWPTICAVFIDSKKGLYTTKFATSPSFPIAIERCLTEFAQCHNIVNQSYTLPHYPITNRKDFFDYGTNEGYQIFNSYTFALNNTVFRDENSWEYDQTTWTKFTESSNKKNLIRLLNLILEKSYDVYIRDVSFLGFPSFHIHIPELSNFIQNIPLKFEKEFNALRANWKTELPNYDFSNIGKETLTYIDEINLAISMKEKNYKKAEQYIDKIINKVPEENIRMPLYCFREYIKMKQDNWTDEQTVKPLFDFFGAELTKQIFQNCVTEEYYNNVFRQIYNSITTLKINNENEINLRNILSNLAKKLEAKYLQNIPDQTKIKEILS